MARPARWLAETMWKIDVQLVQKGMFAGNLQAVNGVAADALAAIKMRDWTKLRLLLHPYLHWTDMDGRVIRGRTRVMAMLERRGDADPPLSIELRDGQIYRWRSDHIAPSHIPRS